jgi:hypothetical protein
MTNTARNEFTRDNLAAILELMDKAKTGLPGVTSLKVEFSSTVSGRVEVKDGYCTFTPTHHEPVDPMGYGR